MTAGSDMPVTALKRLALQHLVAMQHWTANRQAAMQHLCVSVLHRTAVTEDDINSKMRLLTCQA